MYYLSNNLHLKVVYIWHFWNPTRYQLKDTYLHLKELTSASLDWRCDGVSYAYSGSQGPSHDRAPDDVREHHRAVA